MDSLSLKAKWRPYCCFNVNIAYRGLPCMYINGFFAWLMYVYIGEIIDFAQNFPHTRHTLSCSHKACLTCVTCTQVYWHVLFIKLIEELRGYLTVFLSTWNISVALHLYLKTMDHCNNDDYNPDHLTLLHLFQIEDICKPQLSLL